MRATVLDAGSWREWGLLAGAVLASSLLHVAIASGASAIELRAHEEPVWVEMAVAVVEPEPEPEPEPIEQPEPEPEPVPEEPEVIEYAPEPEPPPEPPPAAPEPKPVPRIVQGLSNESFLEGSGTDLTVRAGTTTSVRATKETMELGEADAFAAVPYASVTTAPKARYTPPLEIPPEVIAAAVQGRVELLLTIDAEGKVAEVEVVTSLHPAADAACAATMRKSRWKAGTRDGTPVVVKGVPYSCRFQMSPG